MTAPRPDHPWYGRNNWAHRRKDPRDLLLDREIERAVRLETEAADRTDVAVDLRAAYDPSYAVIENGLRRLPVRYDGSE